MTELPILLDIKDRLIKEFATLNNLDSSLPSVWVEELYPESVFGKNLVHLDKAVYSLTPEELNTKLEDSTNLLLEAPLNSLKSSKMEPIALALDKKFQTGYWAEYGSHIPPIHMMGLLELWTDVFKLRYSSPHINTVSFYVVFSGYLVQDLLSPEALKTLPLMPRILVDKSIKFG